MGSEDVVGRQAPADQCAARRGERGMVTAELAMGVVAAAVLMVLLGGALAMVGLQLAHQGLASEVAELVARGDSAAAAELVDRAEDVEVAVQESPNAVVVTVRRQVDPWGRLAEPLTLTTVARASWQPGEAP